MNSSIQENTRRRKTLTLSSSTPFVHRIASLMPRATTARRPSRPGGPGLAARTGCGQQAQGGALAPGVRACMKVIYVLAGFLCLRYAMPAASIALTMNINARMPRSFSS